MHGQLSDFTLPITHHTWIFFLVLSIILFAPMLLNKLRIPHIIGLILAGILIGEHGLNILERDSSFELFGKVGLLYIMFLAGLELDMEGLMKNRTKGIIFGLLTFFVPFAITQWSCMELLGFDLWKSMLISSIFGAHTLLTYTIVGRYGQTRHPSVVISIGGTIVSLTLSLLFLAGIAGNFSPENGWSFWGLFVAKFIAYTAFIVYVYPRLTKWFFSNYDDNILQYIFVLALIFLSSALAELAGLEDIFGAFMAGLVINRLVPSLSPLMNRIEFVGNALFIPYFLIGTGMLINLRLLYEHPDIFWIIIVFIVVATVTKWLAAFIMQKAFGMSKSGRQMMFGMTNAHAACALAMLMAGTHIDIDLNTAGIQPLIGDNVLNAMIILILVSSIISSVYTEKAARSLALSDKANPKRLKEENILVTYANPHTVEHLTNMALLMHQPKAGCQLIGLHVTFDDSDPRRRVQAHKNLEKATEIAASVDVQMVTINRVSTNIVTGIVHTMIEREATDLVLGLHHKTNLSEKFWGNLTDNLLHAMHRQLVVVRLMMPTNTLHRIVVAVPPKAEYESGFYKWIDRLCNVADQLSCSIIYYCHPGTNSILVRHMEKAHTNINFKTRDLMHWDDVYQIDKVLREDDLLVLVTARESAISYDKSFSQLPSQVDSYFKSINLLIIYPDQYGTPEEETTFTDPRHSMVNRQQLLSVNTLFKKNQINREEV